MAKFISDNVTDAALAYIADNGDKLAVCTSQPTTYTELSSDYKLAIETMTTGHGNGDYTIADGDVSGRKLTMTAQSAISIDTTGTAQHVAIGKSSATTDVLLVATLPLSQALTATNTVTIPAFKYTLPDPT
tara:strand:+ start:2104 stop:2496 length:393 start_codon:yes stop_codon:yes gene_type:complete